MLVLLVCLWASPPPTGAVWAATPSAAGDARADCNWAPFGSICFIVLGGWLDVQTFRVERLSVDPGMICGYSVKIGTRLPNGHPEFFLPDQPRHEGCTPLSAVLVVPGHNAAYPQGTAFCAHWSEDGKPLPGAAPCVTLKIQR